MNRLEAYDESQLLKNPFEFSLRIPVTRTTSYKEFRTADEGLLLPKTFVMERQGSVRMFYAPGIKDAVYGLSDRAQRLYLYILYNLDKNKDHFQLNHEHYTRTNGTSARTYLRAKEELIRYSFITPTQYRTVFWLNPVIFFPGNRLTKYPDHIIVEHES